MNSRLTNSLLCERLALAALLGLGFDAAAQSLPIVEVEGQPLAANVQRALEALDYLGTPLSADARRALAEAGQRRDARRIQELLDPEVLLAVSLNPEVRVKVSRGPAKAVLQQAGYTPVLVKVLNQSTTTAALNISSPQSGPVYAGVAKLSMERQRQEHLRVNENTAARKDRFLDVEMFGSSPMTPHLSGLEVEYALALIYSSEAGKREATIAFDVGQGTQDLGFRGEVPVLFEVKSAMEVKLSVKDHDGQPTVGRFAFHNAMGHVFPPQAKRMAPDFFFQQFIYRADGETVLLPPGKFTMHYGRGPEYKWLKREVVIPAAVDAALSPSSRPSPAGRGSNGSRPTLQDGALPGKTPDKQPTRPASSPLPAGEGKGEGERKAALVALQTKTDSALRPPSSVLAVQLERWVDPMSFGFYSGDHHIHASGCAHYTSPSEGVRPEDMFRQVKGEALNVGCVLTWGPGFDHQHQFFNQSVDAVSEPLTQLKYDIEVSGFGSQALGHVCLLNLKEQIYPGATGSKGWPTWTTPVLRWAKAQGAVTGYAHSGSGLQVNPPVAAKRLLDELDIDKSGQLSASEAAKGLLPEEFTLIDADKSGALSLAELTASVDRAADRLPNLAVPELNSVGAQEIFVTAAHGLCDFISAMDTARLLEWNCWYHLLNCGFPLAVSGETDFPCMSSTRVGQGRVYVQLGKVDKLDFNAWCEGLRQGRSYVSDGYAHALEFKMGDASSGGEVKLAKPGQVSVRAKVAFGSETPLEAAYGGAMPAGGPRLLGDTVNLHDPAGPGVFKDGQRLVELIVNGRPMASKWVPADDRIHELQFDVNVERSSWIALRHFPQMHTNPVRVMIGEQPIRASRQSALWAIVCIEQLWRQRERNIAPNERDEARKTFEAAKEIYRRIAAEAPAGS